MKKTSIYDCTIIDLDKHHSDKKGNLTVVENDTPQRAVCPGQSCVFYCGDVVVGGGIIA